MWKSAVDIEEKCFRERTALKDFEDFIFRKFGPLRLIETMYTYYRWRGWERAIGR